MFQSLDGDQTRLASPPARPLIYSGPSSSAQRRPRPRATAPRPRPFVPEPPGPAEGVHPGKGPAAGESQPPCGFPRPSKQGEEGGGRGEDTGSSFPPKKRIFFPRERCSPLKDGQTDTSSGRRGEPPGLCSCRSAEAQSSVMEDGLQGPRPPVPGGPGSRRPHPCTDHAGPLWLLPGGHVRRSGAWG